VGSEEDSVDPGIEWASKSSTSDLPVMKDTFPYLCKAWHDIKCHRPGWLQCLQHRCCKWAFLLKTRQRTWEHHQGVKGNTPSWREDFWIFKNAPVWREVGWSGHCSSQLCQCCLLHSSSIALFLCWVWRHVNSTASQVETTMPHWAESLSASLAPCNHLELTEKVRVEIKCTEEVQI